MEHYICIQIFLSYNSFILVKVNWRLKMYCPDDKSTYPNVTHRCGMLVLPDANVHSLYNM